MPAALLATVTARLTRAELEVRWRCSRATIERRQRDGILPAPLFLGQKRLWNVADVEAAEVKLRAVHETSVGGVAALAIARRTAARLAEARELEELERAAAAFLMKRSAGDLARAIQRFAADGRIASIPHDHREAALKALTRSAK